MTNWYLVHTKSGYEQKVSKSLDGKKFKSFLPLNKLNYPDDKNRIINRPLFPNLVFVHTDRASFNKILRVRGVQHFLYWLSEPVIIPAADMETLREFVEVHRNISIEKCMVSVERPFESLNFPVIKRDNDLVTIQNTITKLYLPQLGYALSVYHEHQTLEFLRKETLATSFSQS